MPNIAYAPFDMTLACCKSGLHHYTSGLSLTPYTCHSRSPLQCGPVGADTPVRLRVNAMANARNTTVSAIRTRNEIEQTLGRYGTDGFACASQGNLATVTFAMENRRT